MRNKLINFIKKELTEVEEYVNITSKEKREDNEMKTKISIMGATFVACFLSIIICGLSEHSTYTHADAAGTIQTPENNDSDWLDPSILPNDHFNTSSGAMSAIGSTPESEETVNTETTEDTEIKESESETEEIIDTEIESEIPEIQPPTTDTTKPDLSQVVTDKGYYCVWGDFYLTETEWDLVCATVYCETGSTKEPFESKVMVATVIFNQFLDDNPYDNFPDTIKGVIYYKNGGNYSVVKSSKFKKVLKTKGWTEEVELAIKTALAENPYPRDLLYFRNSYYHKNFGVPYKKSGGTYFSTRN